MCSRECYSVSLSRLIAGLLIFLGAFLIGVGTVGSVVTIFLPDAEINKSQEGVEPIAVQRYTSKQDFGQLEVKYECSSTVGDQTTAVFTFTNVGSEAIYFHIEIDRLLTEHFFDATGITNRDIPIKVAAKELAPGESEAIDASMPLGANIYEFSLYYNSGTRNGPGSGGGSGGTALWPCAGYRTL